MVRKKEKKGKIKARKSCLKAGVCYLFIYLFQSFTSQRYLSSPGSLMKP